MRDLVRENTTLLSNLDTARQHLVLHKTNEQRHLNAVRAKVERVPITRVELHRLLLTVMSTDQTDSALFQLYRTGEIFINLAEVPYGPYSSIRTY